MCRIIQFTWLTLIFFSANQTLFAQQETIYTAKRIYVGDTAMAVIESMVCDNDKIVFTGPKDLAVALYPKAKLVDFKNQYIYPGFIDAHCHFLAWCKGLKEADLVGTKSEKAIIKRLQKFAKTTKRSWIVGRGWDQNDWKNKSYPTLEALDKAFPNTPVFLKRIDGHAAWINTAAVMALKLDVNQKVSGGEFIFSNGKFTGILIDNAVDLVSGAVPPLPEAELNAAVTDGANKCYATGLTTLDEAGLTNTEIKYLTQLQQQGKLNLRIYAMLSASPQSFAYITENGMYNDGMMHVGAVKFYLDGALGSRGALLKKDYCDRLGHKGLLLNNLREFENYCFFLSQKSWQVCVHAIGDSANALALQTFGRLRNQNEGLRWRIEHAQIVDPKDFKLFGKYGVVPSVQPTHATSDAPWVPTRLCENRMEGAYNYAELCKQAGIVALGTDFPVEDISPIKTFYSAVTRKDVSGNIKTPFQPEGALTRKQALLGMTLWAAYANREENDKGSLEPNKFADFVVLDTDLMTAPENALKKTKIKYTIIGGKMVHQP
jgi:predicted amidohydrolase YtcJ